MRLTRCMIVVLFAVMVGVSGCASSSENRYPSPRPDDLPVGIDQGLRTPGWDGGYPLRLVAFLLHPVGIVTDLLISQPLYLLASKAPDVFGYTAQDENYRQDLLRSPYHWPMGD